MEAEKEAAVAEAREARLAEVRKATADVQASLEVQAPAPPYILRM